MPIVASRGNEIRRLIADLKDPEKRSGARLRLKVLGARVVPHVDDELGRLDLETRRSLALALADVDTTDGRLLKMRLARAEPKATPLARAASASSSKGREGEGGESEALESLRALPPARPDERPAISRERGEAHLALARAGSRLARKDLLMGLTTLLPGRTRLYCEAAGLIGDQDFVEPLARLANTWLEAGAALKAVAAREKITTRSKSYRALDPSLRPFLKLALGA